MTAKCKHCARCKSGCDYCACCGVCQRCGLKALPAKAEPVPVYVPYYVPNPQPVPVIIQPQPAVPWGPWEITCGTGPELTGTIVQRNYDAGCAPAYQPGVVGTFETSGYVHTDTGSH